jgi:hypothetical protein
MSLTGRSKWGNIRGNKSTNSKFPGEQPKFGSEGATLTKGARAC